MRNLIVRFGAQGGPGIILNELVKKKEKITYHNAYDKKVQLIPHAHQMFDRLILLGGDISLIDDSEFLRKYVKLAENFIQMDKKVLGICLGSQIIAKVLGSEVKKNLNGLNIGFAEFKITNKTDIFNNIGQDRILCFSFHQDIFDIPKNATQLLEYENSSYPNQMFSFENRIFAIQCHLELTEEILKVWLRKKPELHNLIKKKEEKDNLFEQRKQMETTSSILFKNILSK